MIGIYKITNPKGKIYIGQSINIEFRINSYKKCKKSQILLYNSLKKYGYSNHKFEIIEECKSDKLNKRELYWSIIYNSLSPNGLNLRIGNSKGKSSKETCIKISESNRGRKDTEQAKINKSIAAKGKIKTEKHKNNLSGNHSLKKPVIQLSLNNEFINEFSSIHEVSKQTNIGVSDISSCCNNKQKIAKGFKWKFKNPNKNINIFRSQKTRDKISISLKGNTNYGKEVIQYDLEGNFIKKWRSGAEAERAFSNRKGNTYISQCCNGKIELAFGFKWTFKDNKLNINKFIKKKKGKGVLQYDLEGNFIKEYYNIKEANIALSNFTNKVNINMNLAGKTKSAFGYKWKYKEI